MSDNAPSIVIQNVTVTTTPEWHLATAADILRAQVPTILP